MTEFNRRSMLAIGATALATGTLASVGTTAAEEQCPCSPSEESNDWSSLGGNPGNNSYVPGEGGPEPPLTTAWEYDRDGRVAVADDIVYLRTDDGEVHALESADGSVKWQTDDLGADETPAVAHDTVFVGGESLTAIDATNGEVRWQLELDYDWTIPSPNVADDLVFVVADGVLYAIDASEGAERWRFEPDGEPLYERPVAIVDDSVIVPSETRLFARGVSEGRERWTNDDPDGDAEPFSDWTPVATGDFVVVRRGYGNAALTLHDVETGEVLRELSGTHYGRAAATPNGVYAPIGMHHYYLNGYDAATGDGEWESEATGQGTRPPIVDDEHVYTGIESYNEFTDDDEQWTRLFAFDSDGGSVDWQIDTATVPRPLALVDETLYVSGDGLIAVRSEDAGGDDESDTDEEDDGTEGDDEPDDSERDDAENGDDADDGAQDDADGDGDSGDDDTGTDEQDGADDDNTGPGTNDDDTATESSDVDDGGESVEDEEDDVPGFTTGAGIVGGGLTLEWLRRRTTDERTRE